MPLVGASGAIAGILGAHLVLEPRGKITTLIPIVIFVEVASLPAAFVIAFWFALQVTSLLAPVAEGAASTVAWYAHLGGFIVGAADGVRLSAQNASRQNAALGSLASRLNSGRYERESISLNTSSTERTHSSCRRKYSQ